MMSTFFQNVRLILTVFLNYSPRLSDFAERTLTILFECFTFEIEINLHRLSLLFIERQCTILNLIKHSKVTSIVLKKCSK